MARHSFRLIHRLKKLLAQMTESLSLQWDPTFIPNLILCIGVVFVWRGMRNLIDIYFFPENEFFSNIMAIVIGIFFIYLPDNSFHTLGGLRTKGADTEECTEELAEDIAEEVVKKIEKNL